MLCTTISTRRTETKISSKNTEVRIYLHITIKAGDDFMIYNVQIYNNVLNMLNCSINQVGCVCFSLTTVKPLITNTSKEFIKCRIADIKFFN